MWGGAYTGTVSIFNNLIDGWGDTSIAQAGAQAALGLSGPGDGQSIEFENNIVRKTLRGTWWVNNKDGSYGSALLNDISGSNNLFYETNGISAESLPRWSSGSSGLEAALTYNDALYNIQPNSPAANAGVDKGLTHGIYGIKRLRDDIGPFAIHGATLVKESAPMPPLVQILTD